MRDQHGDTIVADAADYRRLVALGFSGRWFTNRNADGARYVRTHRDARKAGGQSLHTVARLILGVPEGQRVGHRNGNKLDLRRRNLFVRDGTGGSAARVALQVAYGDAR